MATETNGQVTRQDTEKYEGGEPLMQFFQFTHLPEHLQGTSRMFYGIAARIITDIPKNPQRDEALDLLLKAKDCAVRAVIYK